MHSITSLIAEDVDILDDILDIDIGIDCYVGLVRCDRWA